MIETVVDERGRIFISTELGGGDSMTVETQSITDNGIRNLLRHFGLFDGLVVKRENFRMRATRVLHTPGCDWFVFAELF